MKGLKGATILAEVISFIFLIITGYALTGTIIFAYGVSVAEQVATGDNLEYTMTMTAGYLPIQNEVALLAMLETDCASAQCLEFTNKISMKKIITEFLMQRCIDATKCPRILMTNADGVIASTEIDTKSAIEASLSGWQTGDYIYIVIMKKSNGIITLAGTTDFATEKNKGEIVKFQKISSKVFSPFEAASLELYVFSDSQSV